MYRDQQECQHNTNQQNSHWMVCSDQPKIKMKSKCENNSNWKEILKIKFKWSLPLVLFVFRKNFFIWNPKKLNLIKFYFQKIWSNFKYKLFEEMGPNIFRIFFQPMKLSINSIQILFYPSYLDTFTWRNFFFKIVTESLNHSVFKIIFSFHNFKIFFHWSIFNGSSEWNIWENFKFLNQRFSNKRIFPQK
jgi:hypothetical protein